MTTTTRQRIDQAAADNGWTAEEGHTETTYQRGDRSVHVEWSVRSSISYARTRTATISGSGKAEQVIAELSR